MSEIIRSDNEGRGSNQGSNFEFVSAHPISSHEDSDQGALDPKVIVLTLWRYKWLFLFFLLLGGSGAWFYAESIVPIYETNGTMMVSSDQKENDELSRIVSQRTGMKVNATLENELQIMRSLSFATKVAEKLMEKEAGGPDEYPVMWRETEEDGFLPNDVNRVSSNVRSGLNFQLVARDAEIIQVSFTSSSPREASTIVNLAMDVYVESSMVQNRQAAEQTTEYLEKERKDLRDRLDESETKLKEYMDRTGLIKLDQQASGVVNKRNQIAAEMENIELDLQGVEMAIQNQEEELERIRPGLKDDFSNAVAPRIRSYQDQLGNYERERYLILSRNPGVRDREVTPPRLKFLDEQIEDLKAEIAELSESIFSDDDEYMGMETAERTQMVTQIQGRLIELKMQKNQLQSRLEAVKQRKDEIEQEFDSMPNEMVELARLQREVDMNEQLYLDVSRQYADMSTWKETQYGYGRIIDKANVPGFPISPNKPILLVMGIVLGGFVAGLIITGREFFDNTISGVDELKSVHLPLLTAIPTIDKKLTYKKNAVSKQSNGNISGEMVMIKAKSSIASESIRRLKNNLIYQNGDVPPKTIAVTSAEQGDGKSTVACNLAVAFAEEGYKTLLVDCDFRRPKVHSFFGFDNKRGVSEYIQGDIQLPTVIKHTDLQHLKVITSGLKREHPESIVGKKEFGNFVGKVEEIFDLIILDTPPFGIVSDSAALFKRAEATIVITKYRQTDKGVFTHTIQELKRINANVRGIVINGYNPKKSTGYDGIGYYGSVYQGYESYAE